jgi:hypothetical protein
MTLDKGIKTQANQNEAQDEPANQPQDAVMGDVHCDV